MDELIEAAKRECGISWENANTEKRIQDITESSVEIISHKLGMHEIDREDFMHPGLARMLLLRFCQYWWNSMEAEFEANYRQEILIQRHRYEVKHGKEETE